MTVPSSRLELSKAALKCNLKTLRRIIGKDRILCSVVKANAYGHGLDPYIRLAEECGIRQFAVYNAQEAATVLDCRTADSSIIIMGDLDTSDMLWAVENGLSFFVYDLSRMDAAKKASVRCGRPARLHLEVETGMYRTGLSARSLEAGINRILRHPDNLVLEGLCSHFAGAESSANLSRIEKQIRVFSERDQMVRAIGMKGFKRHQCCSAAAFLYPQARGDLVRFGIAQYGFWPSLETRLRYEAQIPNHRKASLKRVISWKSRVINLKTIPTGQFIGYGTEYLAHSKTRIANIPVGYSHGIARDQSNRGHVLIRGVRCPIAGLINMNMMSVDVTHVPNIRNGDEVVVLGTQGDEEITVGAFGNRTNDLNYETLARLDAGIERVIVD